MTSQCKYNTIKASLKKQYNADHRIVVVVVVFYCPYAQSINCGEDISVETDECRHISVININVETP